MLLTLSWWIMGCSGLVLLSSGLSAFLLEGHITIAWLVILHSFTMLAALTLKLGYIFRLEAVSRNQKKQDTQ